MVRLNRQALERGRAFLKCHALEPDFRSPSSSAVATEIALRTLQELGAGAGHALVRGAIQYLLSTYDAVSRT